jgi:hypothetical protein
MIVAICHIALVSSSSRKIAIRLIKNGSDLTWSIIESSIGGGLRLPSSEGSWIAPYSWSKVLTFLTKNGSLMLVVYNIKEDFWNELKDNKAIEANDASLFNGNPSEEKVSCKFG